MFSLSGYYYFVIYVFKMIFIFKLFWKIIVGVHQNKYFLGRTIY